jgi:hypothetical protein
MTHEPDERILLLSGIFSAGALPELGVPASSKEQSVSVSATLHAALNSGGNITNQDRLLDDRLGTM